MATTPDRESKSPVYELNTKDLAGEVQLAGELAVTSVAEWDQLLEENPMLPASSAMERSFVRPPLVFGVREPESLDFARMVLQAGRPDEARRLCLKALRWQPGCTDLWAHQADAEDALGDHATAARLRRVAAQCEDEDPGPTRRGERKASIAWTLYGGALIGRGSYLAARKALERAYGLARDDEDRNLAMAALAILVYLREQVLAGSRKVMGLSRTLQMNPCPEARLLREALRAGDLAQTLSTYKLSNLPDAG